MPERKTLNEDLLGRGSSANLPRLHTCENKVRFWDFSQFAVTLTCLATRLMSANRLKLLMSGSAYMHASIASPGFAANHHTGYGWDHLRIVERPDAHIIFSSWCSSQYSLSCVILHVNDTQVQNFDNSLKENKPVPLSDNSEINWTFFRLNLLTFLIILSFEFPMFSLSSILDFLKDYDQNLFD